MPLIVEWKAGQLYLFYFIPPSVRGAVHSCNDTLVLWSCTFCAEINTKVHMVSGDSAARVLNI